jgi:hypothetical protein
MFRERVISTGKSLGCGGQWFNDDWIEFDLGNSTFALDGTGEELGVLYDAARVSSRSKLR